MASNLAFSAAGPTAVKIAPTTSGISLNKASSPAGGALSQAQLANYSFGGAQPVNPQKAVASDGLAQAQSPKPTTPVKAVTQPDGTKTEYHAPATPTTPAKSSGIIPGAGYKVNAAGNGVESVNAEAPTPGQVSGPVPPPAPPAPPTYSGLIGSLADTAKGNAALGANAQEIGARYGKQIADVGQRSAGAQAGYLTTGTNPVAEGNAAVIARTGAAQQTALAQGQQAELMGNAQQLTGQAQQQSGLAAAGGLAQGVQVPYSNQYINPQTGQPVGGAGASGSLQDAVSGVVAKLTSGKMTYADAVNALSGYGQGGMNALQQALPPGFNIAQSNTLGGQQGSVGVNYQLADTALKNVEAIQKQLMGPQTTNIPAINKAANWISTQFGIGSQETRAMTGAVQSLRNAYASLLASSKGGIPSDFSAQAIAEIPNEPTPNDLAAIRQNFETLGKARADILGNPGTSGSSTGAAPTGSAGGFAETW